MSKLRYQPWVGLPNILSGAFVVPEFLQDEATADNLAQALANLLMDPVVTRRLPPKLSALHVILRQNTAARVVATIQRLLGLKVVT